MRKYLTFSDENFAGKVLHELQVAFEQERATVADLIRERVWQEVERYNSDVSAYFNGLVAPSEAEQTLNGYRMKNKKQIDAKAQVATALRAFEKNGFFILVDDRQAESLDEEILLNADTKVTFIKLTPLVGG